VTDSAAQRGVLFPVGFLFAAFVVRMFAGLYQGLGPLDVGAAVWLAGALWVAAPVVGGVLCRELDVVETPKAAVALALIVGLVTVAFIFMAPRASIGLAECPGLPRTALTSAAGAVAVAGLLGFGLAAAELVTAHIARARSWIGAVPAGAALSLGASAAAYWLFYSVVVVCL
jgi:hypothetical protein